MKKIFLLIIGSAALLQPYCQSAQMHPRIGGYTVENTIPLHTKLENYKLTKIPTQYNRLKTFPELTSIAEAIDDEDLDQDADVNLVNAESNHDPLQFEDESYNYNPQDAQNQYGQDNWLAKSGRLDENNVFHFKKGGAIDLNANPVDDLDLNNSQNASQNAPKTFIADFADVPEKLREFNEPIIWPDGSINENHPGAMYISGIKVGDKRYPA